jgi:hypothetical protein
VLDSEVSSKSFEQEKRKNAKNIFRIFIKDLFLVTIELRLNVSE